MKEELRLITGLFPEKKNMTFRCRKTDEFSCLHGLIFDFFDHDRIHDSTVLLILNNPQDMTKTIRTAVLILMQRALTNDSLAAGSQHIIIQNRCDAPDVIPAVHFISH